MSLTASIKDYALDIGYHAVGVCSADPFPQFAAAWQERQQDYAFSPRLSLLGDPGNNLPGAKSIVVAVFDYSRESFPPHLVGKIGRSHMARLGNPLEGSIARARIRLMQQFLEGAGCRVGTELGPGPATSERQAAVRAGVAQFGKNTFICAPTMGTFIRAVSFVVNKELEYDEPVAGLHCPPDCHRCRDACPTGAIVADLRLDPRRCIAYNTFVTRGDNGISPFIPRDIRPKMGAWIHGCDLCQEACPRNQARLRAGFPENPYLTRKAAEFDLAPLLRLSDEFYEGVVHPLMYHYIRDRSLFRRNAAIALGNQGDRGAVPALAAALEGDETQVVRAHAAWALGRLGGLAARAALEKRLCREDCAPVRQEIEAALEAGIETG
jgi:epoxyqueuosine reductase